MSQPDARTLIEHAARDLRSGARPADVVEMLVKNGMPVQDAELLVRKLRTQRGGAEVDGAVLLVGGLVLLAGIAMIAFGIWGMTTTADSASGAGTRGAGKIAGFGAMVAFSGGGMIFKALT